MYTFAVGVTPNNLLQIIGAALLPEIGSQKYHIVYTLNVCQLYHAGHM